MIYSDILQKIEVDSKGCWLWTGAKLASGYGSVRFEGRTRVVHHVTWERCNGAVTKGLDLDHLCRNRLCANPEHLEAVTRSQNLRRGINGFELTGRCRSGKHEATAENTYTRPNGDRACRACRDARRRTYYMKAGI